MAFIRENLQRLANKSTKVIAMRWGEVFPFWYVCEYPKAGGTWLCRMLADYLDIPFPQYTVTPLGFQCVIHNHWTYSPRLRRCFYLSRDGRDVMVSFFFYRMKNLAQHPESAFNRRIAARYAHAFGPGYDPNDIRRLLPMFIEMEMTRPLSARINWPTHVGQWAGKPATHVAYLTYEHLLADAPGTLARTISQFSDKPIDHDRLHASVARYAFSTVTGGRKPGQEDRSSFVRKGVAGDWKNHFTRAAAEVFDRFAGDTLIHLGYESDRSWIDVCPAS